MTTVRDVEACWRGVREEGGGRGRLVDGNDSSLTKGTSQLSDQLGQPHD